MATLPRSIRIPSELWDTAVRKAQQESTTVTAVVLAALQDFTATTGDTMSSTIAIGRVSHLTETDAFREIDLYMLQGEEISDRCAATIASWFQSAGTADMPLTMLASGTPVPVADVLEAIAHNARQFNSMPNMLDALGHWAAGKSDAPVWDDTDWTDYRATLTR